ncbi:MAG: Asp-tRNA(Asn)/Glu-tRNA(Gln) amidotransferase subunit GatC [Patescibacteria group bacterium]|nr:Asp-tRNA(Asn)/Glu-tRNA(Gln) amidotransferase subunit GatC [Patescibacteria group bacterium]
MKVSKEQVEHIAKLAKLKLKDDETSKMQTELNQILDYMDKLNELDTSNVEPLSHPIPIENVFREDEVKPSIDRESAMKNAPDHNEEFFKVPKVI